MGPPGAVDREFLFFLYIDVLLFFVVFLFPLFPCFLGPQDLLRRAPGALQGPSRHPPGPSRHLPGPLGAQNAPTRLSVEILFSITLRGPLFEGFEGEMARDISKMTFKKLIQFRKSIFLFRNAPSNLPVDLPRTRYLRGQRFANPENFRVSLSKF